MSFVGDTESRRSLLAGVYAKGSKDPMCNCRIILKLECSQYRIDKHIVMVRVSVTVRVDNPNRNH